MPNHPKYSKPNFKLKNTSQQSTTIPEHESTEYFIAACVLCAAHLVMTFIEKTSYIHLYALVVKQKPRIITYYITASSIA